MTLSNTTPRSTGLSRPSRLRRVLKRVLTVAMLGVAASSVGACAIHTQGPVKEVAYDFSDADFYDRDYAPSPNYANRYEEIEVVVPVATAADRPAAQPVPTNSVSESDEAEVIADTAATEPLAAEPVLLRLRQPAE